MWAHLQRARRRLRPAALAAPGAPGAPGAPPAGSRPDTAPSAAPPRDLSLALGRPELGALIEALEPEVRGPAGRPDTPARLEAALGSAIARAGGHGRPTVTRRPAGLHTPETWQVRIEGADAAARAVLERGLRGDAA